MCSRAYEPEGYLKTRHVARLDKLDCVVQSVRCV